MKILKIVFISIWIIIIIALTLNIQVQRIQIRFRAKTNMEYLMKSSARMYAEYYYNLNYLRKKSDCKSLADSIFSNSDFLKNYELKYLANQKK